MGMNKSGKMNDRMIMFFVVALIAVGLGGLWYGGQQQTTQPQTIVVPAQSVAQSTTPVSANTIVDAQLCSGDPSPTFTVNTINSADKASKRYASNIVSFLPLTKTVTGGEASRFKILTQSGTTAGDKQETSRTACLVKYETIVETNISNTNGAYFNKYTRSDGGVVDIVASPSSPNLYEFQVTNFSDTKCRVYDEELRDYVWNAAESRSGVSTGDTGYVATGATNFYQSGTNATNKTVNSDESTKWYYTFDCLAINPQSAFGITAGVAVDTGDDTNAADWDDATLVFRVDSTSGTILSDIISSLSAKDKEGLAKFEHVYNLGKPIGGITPSMFNMRTGTGGGVNPDYTIQLKLLASSIVESSLTPGVYLGKDQSVPRYYDDAATPVLIASATDNSIFIPST